MQTIQDFTGSTDMWSTSAGGHLMKVVNLTGFTVYRPVHAVSSFTIPGIFCRATIARNGYEHFGGTYCLDCQGKVLLT